MKVTTSSIGDMHKVCGTDENAEILRRVFFDNNGKGPRLLASNGHAAAIIPLSPEEIGENDKPGPIPTDALVQGAKLAGKSKSLALELDAQTVMLSNGVSIPREGMGLSFPNIDAALPKESEETVFSIRLNPEALYELYCALVPKGKRSGYHGVGVTLEFKGERRPIVVKPNLADRPEAFGVLMPMTKD